ncbi:MAG: hypothetical protein AAFY43_09915 [Pseudomonadota bacterium]
MRALRIGAMVFGATLIGMEVWRSLGAGRGLPFVFDDVLVGGLLIASAVLMSRDTTRRRAFFTASWGLAAGCLYNGFFQAALTPTYAAGPLSPSQIVLWLGLAMVVAIAGTVASILAERVIT